MRSMLARRRRGPPEITVDIDDTGIAVRDNGPGMPPEHRQGARLFGPRVQS